MIVVSACIILLVTGCTTIQKIAGISDPELTVKDVSLQDITFDTATLLFDIDVRNPNNHDARVSGFTYNLSIDDQTVVEGQQEDGFVIKKKESSMVHVPITLAYKTIYSTLRDVAEKDEFDYRMLVNMQFDLPVIGKTVIPVKYEDTLPVLRIPEVTVESLKLNSMTLTGADIDLRLNINNPNDIELKLDNLNYTFDVNGQNWVKGITVEPMELGKKKASTLQIPMTLNFITMGKTVYNSLTESTPLAYTLNGSCNAHSSVMKTSKSIQIPIQRSGQVTLLK
jgi:LEA14-like dessication related protein